MANTRLYNDPKPVSRFYLASPKAFADWENPTVAELNANPTNDPNGLIFNITCALRQSDTQFDLGDSDTDDELSFCQTAGAVTPTSKNPEITYTAYRSAKPWVVSDSASLDVANLTFSLLSHRGVEYFGILSVGRAYDEPFAVGDEVKMVHFATDTPVDGVGSGESVTYTSSPLSRGNINWNHTLAA